MPKLLILLLITFIPLAGATKPSAPKSYNLAVLDFQGEHITKKRWLELSHYLSTAIAAPVNFFPMKNEGIIRWSGNFDMILTNPISAVAIAESKKHDIVATLNHQKQGPQYAGVVIVHKDSPITRLSQLSGKSVGVTNLKLAAGGFLFAAYELVQLGMKPDPDFDRFTQISNQVGIVQRVIGKQIDAGFIRTGMLNDIQEEQMQNLDISQVRILNEKTDTLPYPRSTDIYPHWGFLISKEVPKNIQNEITQALYRLTPTDKASKDAKINGFVDAFSGREYLKVKTLMQSLKVPPFNK
ncbi:phosphate/phosphite/phosphonate ABC transporter substrate-binding protein [Thalassomonas viridans]|uniref:Phosphate/phosphite/phosphonate ABC transporter substrate-binding protein n=1 Tax=Thalassomonas viridans TaxID=137584 RepID=A0AAE9Z7I7_9GAMM|nr:phosphate/phosphite/phosphonate ABC transporter substrate-binding protein [Thalassomonas viridans]WDE07687.1 phosphate/phosphite/phosphonate ABC transporter substrate-binding protein [Thalassomonas viridans]